MTTVTGNLTAAISATARRAARDGDWAAVDAAASQILGLNQNDPEGWFLRGLSRKAAGRVQEATDAFSQTIRLDPGRYDAAIELAWIYWSLLRHQEAKDLLEGYEQLLANSPLYLDMAAETWSRLGLHARALPLYRKACELQPEVDKFQAGLAACSVLCGELSQAGVNYSHLLDKYPNHQRNHYEWSRLKRAIDSAHVDQMKAVLERTGLSPEKNIFLYYAIAKELEDLELWDESFHYYRMGGDAAAGLARTSGYKVSNDIALIDKIIEVCGPQWLSKGVAASQAESGSPSPIFVVGLPRTGTTLTERILASHSEIESADETFFLQIAIRRISGVAGGEEMTPRMIELAAGKDPVVIGKTYLDAVRYRLSGKSLFIDKYPFNFHYLGFVARSFPQARIVHLRRNPMDACLAMYKQPFFRFAFALDDLGLYYLAYDRLMRHWREVLGHRLIEVHYENLVSDQETQTRLLLQKLGLEFEQGCLEFEKNKSASASASSVQIREKIHTRSVNRWTCFAQHLRPLEQLLTQAGIAIG